MGFVWLDRHLHKNGGSTVRELMRRHEEAGGCVYWGYSLSAESWPRLLRLLRSLNSSEARPPSLCVEEHGSAASARFVTTHLPDLLRLRELYRQQRVRVPIVLTTRVREPLSYYLSFYRWKILGMQLHGNRIALSPGHEAINPIGSSFLEWTPPNLQSVGLLHGDVELFAGLRQGGFPGVRAGRRRPHPYWVANHRFEARHFKALLRVLSSFDVVAPLEQFDAASLLTAELTGLPPLQAARLPLAWMPFLVLRPRATRPCVQLGEEDRVVSPRALGVPQGVNTSYAFICPDMAACRAHVHRIAPPSTAPIRWLLVFTAVGVLLHARQHML
ncbi:hypothetical protein AB1Y20_003612 [Prymnesium parvum]|uniref:Uncharacterized protein n=1 Tax=Prymnesium parvum TaxID=97485 RepID=A0AB34J572_PRYPA